MELSEIKSALKNRKSAKFDGIECFVVGYQVLISENGTKTYSVGLREKRRKHTLYWININKVILEE